MQNNAGKALGLVITTRAAVKLPLQKNLSDAFSGSNVDSSGEN